MIPVQAVSLGLLAGGEGRRIGGRDKAWTLRGGVPLVQGLLAAIGEPDVAARLASVRATDARWAGLGFETVRDARAGFAGPLAGLEALAHACRSDWLYVLPVDVLDPPGDLLDQLRRRAGQGGAWVRDAEGLQPLLGLWPVKDLARVATAALDAGEPAVHRALAALGPAVVDLSPRVLGNANSLHQFDPMP